MVAESGRCVWEVRSNPDIGDEEVVQVVFCSKVVTQVEKVDLGSM